MLLVLLLAGCERPVKGRVEFGFRNLSTKTIWVESASFSKGDVGPGLLVPRSEYCAIVIDRRRDPPAEMMIEWWEGRNHNRPSSAELIYEQKVILPDLDPLSKLWHIYLTFDKDGTWIAKLEK